MLEEPMYRIVFDDKQLNFDVPAPTVVPEPPELYYHPEPPELYYHIEFVDNRGQWERMRPGFASFRAAEEEIKRMALRSQEYIATYDCFGKQLERWDG